MAKAKAEIEKVTLQVDAPPMTGQGLSQAKAQLMAIDALMAKINRGFAGLAESAVIKKSATQIKRELETAFKGKPVSTKPEDLAKAMGLDPKAFRSFVDQANAELRRLMVGGEFRNLTAASKGLAKFTSQESRRDSSNRQAVADFLGAGVRPAEVQSVSKAILSGGPIILEVPAASVQAVLVGGPVQVVVPSSGTPSGAATAAAVVTTSGGGAGPGAPDIGAPLTPGTTQDELRRRVTQTRRSIKAEITRSLGVLDTITETFDKAGVVTKTVTDTRAGDRRIQELKERLALIRQGLLGGIDGSFSGVRSADLRSKAALQRRAASEIDLLAKSGALADLGGAPLEDSFRAQAAKLKQSANKSSRQAAIAARKEAGELEKAELRDQAAAARGTAAELKGAQVADAAKFQARANYDAWWRVQVKAQEGAARLAELEAKGFTKGREIKGTRTTAAGEVATRSVVYSLDRGGVRTSITATSELGKSGEVLAYRFSEVARALKSSRAEASAAGRNFFQNTAHVSAWAASVFTLYGALNLAKSSLGSLVQTGLQTARLGQVFRGVGGSASLLRDNVLALAAANGRGSEEAMDSAIRWSRLGLTRAQVNEAVRVSLVAANVAELDAATATEKLQSIMTSYQLGVGQLAGELGQLNQLSNTYNVTNKDLLDGLSRVASVAKQVGLPLGELQGLLAATIGITGQTGANIGNSFKSLMISLSNPTIQKFLRQEFKLEVRNDSGDVKDMSDKLSELYVKYQELTKAEREYLLVQVAGKTQASRVAALLDNYIEGQVRGINAMLNLNSAEKENAQIKATLAASLKSVATEWERLVAQQGNRGLTQGMMEVSVAFRNLLSIFNSPVGSAALTGFLILLTALSARMLVTGMQMRALSTNSGFLGKSMLQLRGIMASLDLTMRKSVHDWNMMLRTSGSLAAAIQGRVATAFTVLKSAAAVAGTAVKAAGIGLVTILPELAMVYGATWLFNQAMEALGGSSEAAERKLAGFNAEAERAVGAANAATQTARLLNVVQKSLPNMHDRGRNVGALRTAGIITPDEEKAILDAAASGHYGKSDAIFRGKILEQQHKAMLERSRHTAEVEHQIAARMAENDRLRKSPLASATRIAEGEQVLQELRGKRTKMILEDTEGINDSAEEMLSQDTQHLANLERQKLLLESISEIYSSLSSDPLDKAAAGIAADQAKLQFLKAQEVQVNDTVKARAADDVLNRQQIAHAEEELKIRQLVLDADRERYKGYIDIPFMRRAATWSLTGESIVSLQSPTEKSEKAVAEAEKAIAELKAGTQGPQEAIQRAMAQKIREERQKVAVSMAGRISEYEVMQRIRERRQISTDQAKSEGDSFNFGFDSEDRLRNRQAGIVGLIAAKKKALETGVRDNSVEAQRLIVQLIQHQVDLREVYLEKQRLGNQLHKEEQELIRSKIKEFQKGLITAGPGELLRKLAAVQLGSKGMTSGQFFSMAPAMREDLGLLYPSRFNPEVAEIRNQRLRLGDPDSTSKAEDKVGAFGSFIGELMSMLATMKISMASPVLEMAATAKELNAVAGSAQGAAAALSVLGTNLADATNALRSWSGQLGGGRGLAGAPYLPDATGYSPGGES